MFYVSDQDRIFRLTEELLASEEEFLVRLRGIQELYGGPLTKLSAVTAEEGEILFDSINPVIIQSQLIVDAVSTKMNYFKIKKSKSFILYFQNCIYIHKSPQKILIVHINAIFSTKMSYYEFFYQVFYI